MKLKGFVVIMTYTYPTKGEVTWELSEPSDTLSEAERIAYSMYDDKWDYNRRHRYRFYILNLSTMKLKKCKHWNTPFNYKKWRKTGEAGN